MPNLSTLQQKFPRRVLVTWRRTPDGGEATILIPTPAHATRITTTGRNRQDALVRATAIAKAAMSNPLVAAVLPPGAGAAVYAVSALAKNPTVQQAEKFVGPGAKRLFKALKRIV